MSTHNLCFKQKYEKLDFFFFLKNIRMFLKIFIIWVVKFSVYLNMHIFLMEVMVLIMIHIMSNLILTFSMLGKKLSR